MILFIRKIPKGTLPSELHDVVSPALNGGLFSESGQILHVDILAIKIKDTDVYEFHGLVHVDSETAGHRALNKLRGTTIKGMPVTFHEYTQRDWHNDRRESQLAPLAASTEKRAKDRRRGVNIEIIDDIASIWAIFAVNQPTLTPEAART
jgi:hypothetical protein